MKFENLNMNNNCEEIQLLIEDYLDGMISTENKTLMEKHISSCNTCKAYLEYTVMLIDNTSLMARQDRISDEKKEALWSNIERSINQPSGTNETQIYNMSGFEDEYITPRVLPKVEGNSRKWSSFRYYISGLAAMFALAFIIYLVSQFKKGGDVQIVSNNIVEIGTKWKVSTVKGSPMINDLVMKNTDSISPGQYIVTDDSSRAELTVANLGTVTIEPNTKVRFVKSIEGESRIELVYGSIDADILAKPRSFFVDAGKVTAVDLGCSYKISMDEKGDGLLYVKSGRVSLESAGGRESLVPEGKFCVLKKDIGPGTPFRGDTSPELKKALMDFDFGNCGGQCVNIILKNAKKTDAVTLINMLPHLDEENKVRVYTKAANFAPPPKSFPKDSIQKQCKIEKLNEWVDKVMEEVHKNLEENMKIVEENMKNFDSEKWGKEWEKNFKHNWQFNYDTNVKYDFNFEVPSPEEMHEMQRDLNEMQNDLQRDNEEFKREMERFKEEMQRVGEEIKKENIERQKDADEQLKDMQERQKEKEERMREKKERQREKEERIKEKTPEPPEAPEPPKAPEPYKNDNDPEK